MGALKLYTQNKSTSDPRIDTTIVIWTISSPVALVTRHNYRFFSIYSVAEYSSVWIIDWRSDSINSRHLDESLRLGKFTSIMRRLLHDSVRRRFSQSGAEANKIKKKTPKFGLPRLHGRIFSFDLFDVVTADPLAYLIYT